MSNRLRTFNKVIRAAILTAIVPAVVAAVGCHSYHIETTIENRTGGPIRLLEVE